MQRAIANGQQDRREMMMRKGSQMNMFVAHRGSNPPEYNGDDEEEEEYEDMVEDEEEVKGGRVHGVHATPPPGKLPYRNITLYLIDIMTWEFVHKLLLLFHSLF